MVMAIIQSNTEGIPVAQIVLNNRRPRREQQYRGNCSKLIKTDEDLRICFPCEAEMIHCAIT
jgi:hypothetical protein